MEDSYDNRTKLPTALDEEDPFLSLAEVKLSLRQILTILFSCMIWYGMMELTQFILPLSAVFAAIVWAWMPLGGIFMTFKQKDGRPYEEYLSKKIVFLISERYFILKDPHSKEFEGGVEDADWKEIEEGYF
jgi:hypothetical protein